MSFIILGDVHIGKSLGIGKPASGQSLNSRLQDSIDLLDFTLEQAAGCKAIILTGDVYEDARPHPAFITLFMRWIAKCKAANIEVHIIAGNHDIMRTGSYTISALDIIPAVRLENVFVYKDFTQLSIHGQNFTFAPYRDRRMYEADTSQEALKKLLEELPEPKGKDILIGHLAIEGGIFIGDEIDDMLNEIFIPPEAFKHHYTFMGHIHRFQRFNRSVYHTGSMERSDFGDHEINEDKFLIKIENSEPSFIKIPNRNIRKIAITVPSDKDSTDFVNNELCLIDKKTSLNEAIVKLEITLASDVENCIKQKVLDFLYTKLNVHHVCLFSESRSISEIIVDKESTIDIGANSESAIRKYFSMLKDVDDTVKEEAMSIALQINSEVES